MPSVEELCEARRWDEAEIACRQVLAAEPGNAAASFALARIALGRGEDAACRQLRAIVPRTAGDIDIALSAAKMLLRFGDLEGAAAGLRRVTAIEPRRFAPWFELGRIEETLGRPQAALAAYEQAIAINAGDGGPWTRRGVIMLRESFGAPLRAPREKRQASGLERPVTMTSLGYNGRFGNQLLQYAFARCYGAKHSLRVDVPEWMGRWLFDLSDPYPDPSRPLPLLREQGEMFLNSWIGSSNEVFSEHDLWGYFGYHTRHYLPYRDFIRTLFRPGTRIGPIVERDLARLREHGRTLVALHLRRGDYGKEERFWIAPEEWYLAWLDSIWAGLEQPLLYIASDDPEIYQRFAAFRPLTSALFDRLIPGAEFYHDFHVLAHADRLAISNSNFSFLAAMLNERASAFLRPHPDLSRLVPFDPWDARQLMQKSRA